MAAVASIRTLGFDGAAFGAEAIDATLPPGSAVLIATRPLSAYGTEEERKARFLSLALGEARNDWFFAPFKESPVAEAKIKAEVSGGSVTLSTDKPAFFVWLELPGVKGEFSDNSFTLLPGEKRTVEFSKAQVIDPAKLSVSSLR
ncbi:MAG: hypothetical protein IKO40_10870 [Kiritimatiellae bacterium]|nr:hypothetical protein [Kiritimatiellia bacterium]